MAQDSTHRVRAQHRWLLAIAWCTVCSLSQASAPFPKPLTPPACPSECICLSQSQVVCNSVTIRGVPSALSPTVTQLSISRADLRVLRSDAFSHLRLLERVTLDACNITRIRPFAFRGLTRLRHILIQHTPLTTVDGFAFAALQNITTIELSHNKIAQIEGYAFAGTNTINLISFRHNPLKRILRHAFSGLSEVTQIDFGSGIKSIEPMAFAGLEGVDVLELSFMDLPSLLPDTFHSLTRVGKLALRDSDLGIIREGAFDGLQRVRMLELANNKIDGIEELYLVQNNSVNQFKLTGNHMLENPESVVLEVDELIIRGNHLPCECGKDPQSNPLAILANFENENYCISPLKVRGLTLEAAASGACRADAGGSARARAGGGGAAGAPPLPTKVALLLALIFSFATSNN